MHDVRPGARPGRRRRHPALAVAVGPRARRRPSPVPRIPLRLRRAHPNPTTKPSATQAAPSTAQAPSAAAASPTIAPPRYLPVDASLSADASPSAMPTAPAAAASARAAAALTTNAQAQLPGGGRHVSSVTTTPCTSPSMATLRRRLSGCSASRALAATIRRANTYAARYEPLHQEDRGPGAGDHRDRRLRVGREGRRLLRRDPVATLRPLVTRPRLPASTSCSTCSRGAPTSSPRPSATELLAQPHVGLALDPEWRLQANQRHLRQIGSVNAGRDQRVSQWLADFTRRRQLPQKMLLLHQFRLSMIRSRRAAQHRPSRARVRHPDGRPRIPARQAGHLARCCA